MNYDWHETDDVDINTLDGQSFECKTKILGKTSERSKQTPHARLNRAEFQTPQPPQPTLTTLNVKVTIPLKYFSNFGRYLDLPLLK